MNTTLLDELEAHVQNSKLDPRFKESRSMAVAMLHGPSIVIEAMVYIASKKSGIAMDWGFVGGRAIIYALGNTDEVREKARSALAMAKPGGDVGVEDI